MASDVETDALYIQPRIHGKTTPTELAKATRSLKMTQIYVATPTACVELRARVLAKACRKSKVTLYPAKKKEASMFLILASFSSVDNTVLI